MPLGSARLVVLFLEFEKKIGIKGRPGFEINRERAFREDLAKGAWAIGMKQADPTAGMRL